MTIQRRTELDKICNEVVVETSKISQIFKSESPTQIRAHVDSWILFVVITKLNSEKTLDLAEWEMLDDLKSYIVESMAEQIEKNPGQIMDNQPIKDDDEVIMKCGKGNLPLGTNESDDEDNYIPGQFNVVNRYFKGTKTFKMPAALKKREEESDEAYKKRVRKWLYAAEDHEFTQVSYLVDNERPEE